MRLLRRYAIGAGAVACLAALAGACGSRAVPPDVRPSAAIPLSDDLASACEISGQDGERIASIGLSEPVDPGNAPQPSNDSERLLFRQLYETLVRVDCEGRVHGGLADSWRLDEDGRTWHVTLREHAQFSDGTPVTPADVVSSWSRAGAGGELARHPAHYVESITPVDGRTLAITLRSAADMPGALADTSLAVARRAAGHPWPLGTRGVRVSVEAEGPGPGGIPVITLTGLPSGTSAADSNAASWSMRAIVVPGRDRRDFLDDGIDLLVTRDPATLDYAATLPQYISLPLVWDRTYVFLPSRSQAAGALSADAREALAGDAVRGEARGAQGPFWWEAGAECGIPIRQGPDRQSSTTGRIAYEQGDAAAQDLAERLVGLAGAPPSRHAAEILEALSPDPAGRTFKRAAGIAIDALAPARAAGLDAGYIVSLARTAFDRCGALRAAGARVGPLDPNAIVPLADTRPRAIVRRGRSGVTMEADGGLLVTPAAVER